MVSFHSSSLPSEAGCTVACQHPQHFSRIVNQLLMLGLSPATLPKSTTKTILSSLSLMSINKIQPSAKFSHCNSFWHQTIPHIVDFTTHWKGFTMDCCGLKWGGGWYNNQVMQSYNSLIMLFCNVFNHLMRTKCLLKKSKRMEQNNSHYYYGQGKYTVTKLRQPFLIALPLLKSWQSVLTQFNSGKKDSQTHDWPQFRQTSYAIIAKSLREKAMLLLISVPVLNQCSVKPLMLWICHSLFLPNHFYYQ